MRRNYLIPWTLGALVMLGLARVWAAPPAAPTLSRAQLEADWLRQDALRNHVTSATLSAAAIKAQSAKISISPADDAAGGCDGVKNGEWGFHTALEPNPWWRVDLGRPTPLDHILLYNRSGFEARTLHLQVAISNDDKTWTPAAQNPGKVFHGFADGKPLNLDLHGAVARYVRLQLPGKTYFHLDEVEIYPAGGAKNIALGRPATQSSVSQWSASHAHPAAAKSSTTATASLRAQTPSPVPADLATAKVIERGLRLAAALNRQGVATAAETLTLNQLSTQLSSLPPTAPAAEAQRLFFAANAAVRTLALRNPLLDFDSVVFVKHAPSRFPHMSDQFYGWWSRPGGGICILSGIKGANPTVRCLTTALPEGSFQRPDLSYDGRTILFAYARYYPELANERNKADKRNVPEDAFYHLYEVSVDGGGLHRLTRGKYDDFSGVYLPGGEVAFLSTRKGVALQNSQAAAFATTQADLPDSYVRCGGDAYRPVPVFTLHTIDAAGGNLRQISAFENFEWTPAVAADGRLLYTRWDYIDRFNGHFFSLWSTNPDGTNAQLVYGNYTTKPQVKFEARPVPGSSKLIMTAGAHHSNIGGTLVLLDRTRGTEEADPIQRLTPEVPYPETVANVGTYYANPWPLSEEHFLVSWSDRHLPPHGRYDDEARNPTNASGLYLYDAFGNLTLLYRDASISSLCPIPLRPRPRPPVLPSTVEWAGAQEGDLMLKDVYQGLPGVERGTVKRLRIVAVPPKVQPNMNQPSLGVSREEPGKYVLGTVPVEPDGSAWFRVPSGVPLFFQALDSRGLAVQTMRSLAYVQPGQTLSCVGCHEPREAAPAGNGKPQALRRGASRLTLGPSGSWPLSYDHLVQPVLDRNCVTCHQPGSKDVKAAKLDLTAARSYASLLGFGGKDLAGLALERDRSVVGETPARQSKLFAMLTAPAGHGGVRLDAESLERLIIWMDTYAQQAGHFSPGQALELEHFRTQLAPLLEPYHPGAAAMLK